MGAICELYGTLPLEVRIDAGFGHSLAHLVASDGLVLARAAVHHDEIAQLLVLGILESVGREAGAVLGEPKLIIGEELVGPEALQGVGPYEQGKVGELLDEGFVVPAVVHDELGHREEDRGV